MVFVIMVISMLLCFEIGKGSKGFKLANYFLASLLALVVVAAALYHMFTMTKPPLY
jgi:hypothetical protein